MSDCLCYFHLRVSNNNDEACNDVLTKSIEGNDEYNNRDENDWSDDEDENALVLEL